MNRSSSRTAAGAAAIMTASLLALSPAPAQGSRSKSARPEPVAGATYTGTVVLPGFGGGPAQHERFTLQAARDRKSMSLVGSFTWGWWAHLSGGSCRDAYGNYEIASVKYRKTHPYRGGPYPEPAPTMKVSSGGFSGAEEIQGGRVRISGSFSGPKGKRIVGQFMYANCGGTLRVALSLAFH
jgi:hypothetical protein